MSTGEASVAAQLGEHEFALIRRARHKLLKLNGCEYAASGSSDDEKLYTKPPSTAQCSEKEPVNA